MRIEKIMVFVSVGLLLAGCGEAPSDKYSRGVGIYPGNPDETFAPELVEDNETYRNVAALKAAWHSSSYDYNLTAQLVTDGVISTEEPGIINVSTQNGSLKKNEREWFFDDKPDSKYIVEGNDIYLQFDFDNMDIETDKIVLRGDVVVDSQKLGGYEVAAYATADGVEWEELNNTKGNGYLGAEPAVMRGRGARSAVKAEPGASPVIFKYDYKPTAEEPPMMSFKSLMLYFCMTRGRSSTMRRQAKGSTRLAAPTSTAVAPASISSMTSSALITPPRPTIGMRTAS